MGEAFLTLIQYSDPARIKTRLFRRGNTVERSMAPKQTEAKCPKV